MGLRPRSRVVISRNLEVLGLAELLGREEVSSESYWMGVRETWCHRATFYVPPLDGRPELKSSRNRRSFFMRWRAVAARAPAHALYGRSAREVGRLPERPPSATRRLSSLRRLRRRRSSARRGTAWRRRRRALGCSGRLAAASSGEFSASRLRRYDIATSLSAAAESSSLSIDALGRPFCGVVSARTAGRLASSEGRRRSIDGQIDSRCLLLGDGGREALTAAVLEAVCCSPVLPACTSDSIWCSDTVQLLAIWPGVPAVFVNLHSSANCCTGSNTLQRRREDVLHLARSPLRRAAAALAPTSRCTTTTRRPATRRRHNKEDDAPMTEAEAIRHFATMQQAAYDRAFFTDGERQIATAERRADHDRRPASRRC